VLVAACVAAGAGPALASQTIDRNVNDVRLAVNAKGEALVTYKRANGQVRRLLAWEPTRTLDEILADVAAAHRAGRSARPVMAHGARRPL